MTEIKKITEILENFASLTIAEQWDNSGWQINLDNTETNNIMLCLSLTPNVLEQAIKNNCDLIVSHHPLIFNEFKKIEYKTVTQKLIVDCIKNNIQVYSAHTNLDATIGGVNDTLCEKLGLIPTQTIEKFVKIAILNDEIMLDDFILKLKISLGTEKIKIINPNNKIKIKKIALCCGSGGEFINSIPKDTDLFITGDIKYHAALDVQDLILIDAGHFETEKIVLPTLKNLLENENINIFIAKEKSPWVVV